MAKGRAGSHRSQSTDARDCLAPGGAGKGASDTAEPVEGGIKDCPHTKHLKHPDCTEPESGKGEEALLPLALPSY